MSCKTEKKEEKEAPKETKATIAAVSADMMESAVIYEANIRQYSKEGTFEAFTKDIPQLRKLGVKIIWVMPIFPISETKRKATGDKFVSEIEDPEERKKYLGSYYAVSDFTKINPEFGTIEDFRKLVKTAHENDIYVILDWVPNHTGWDHPWIKTNPEFYTKNADEQITEPLEPDGTTTGWADVADLNYDNKELRKTMIKQMKYWLAEENVDGFRCDVAGYVPTDFWEEAIPQLRATKDIFMLAEAWQPELLKGKLFDMAYGGIHITV
jgi:glycosidase